VAAHGSRAAAANDAHRAVVARLAGQVPVEVVPAFLELTGPSIAEAIDQAVAGGATTVAVLPYFLHPGRHLTEDLPRIVSDAAARHPGATVRLASSFGADPVLGEVLAAQVRRAVGGG
jgi:sirohydrochlorin ferrochelatase